MIDPAVLFVIALIHIGFELLEAVQVFVRVKRIGFQLDQSDRDVGAVIRNTLVVGQKIIEYKALPQRAESLLQAVDMVELHFVAEIVDQLFERLDAGSKL